MNYYPQFATGEQLLRIAEDYEDRMAAREFAIEGFTEHALADRRTLTEILKDACATDDTTYDKLIDAVVEMANEYYATARRTDAERERGILDAFIELSCTLEKITEQAAVKAVDGRQ